jgi:hypothetical protein
MADEENGPDEPEETPELPKVNYSSNSNKAKSKMTTGGGNAGPSEKNLSKIVEGDVVQRKKPLGKKFIETFSGETLIDVRDYVFMDVLAPGLKDLIYEIVTQAIHR